MALIKMFDSKVNFVSRNVVAKLKEMDSLQYFLWSFFVVIFAYFIFLRFAS